MVVTLVVGTRTAIDHRNDLAASHIDDWENALKVEVALIADSRHRIKFTVTCHLDCVAPPVGRTRTSLCRRQGSGIG
jgi:hypothetical protein